MTESIKSVITVEEFEKKVEIEAQNLMYFDHVKKEKAFVLARDYVGAKFQTA